MSSLNDFGRIITEERKKKGMTQDELAAALNITPQAVSKWENGVGLPDVTLFPKIAGVLGIPIGQLFGSDSETGLHEIPEFPTMYGELPFICSLDGIACFSDKSVDRVEKDSGIVFFKDSSTADLGKLTAVNTGSGEIRLIKYDEYERRGLKCFGSGATTYEHCFGAFKNLSVSMSLGGDVKILRSGPAGRVVASGMEYFISLIDAKCNGDLLEVKVNQQNGSGSNKENNTMEIFTGFERGGDLNIKINGESVFLCEPYFDSMNFGINGAGDIKAVDTGSLVATINGSGNIEVGATGDALIKINGAGDVICASAKTADMKINGAGDIKIEKPEGDITIKISGSGDFKCGEGSIDKLIISVSGSGDIKAQKLTTREANIEVRGGADITIGRIIEHSVEKLSKESKLKVLQRG